MYTTPLSEDDGEETPRVGSLMLVPRLGRLVGARVDIFVGPRDGDLVGTLVVGLVVEPRFGGFVGLRVVGLVVVARVGDLVGTRVVGLVVVVPTFGDFVGARVGNFVAPRVGNFVGALVGVLDVVARVGDFVGPRVGNLVGALVGALVVDLGVGRLVGARVGAGLLCSGPIRTIPCRETTCAMVNEWSPFLIPAVYSASPSIPPTIKIFGPPG